VPICRVSLRVKHSEQRLHQNLRAGRCESATWRKKQMWLEIIIMSIIVIPIVMSFIKRGRLPEWQDLHGDEYLKWKRGEKAEGDSSD